MEVFSLESNTDTEVLLIQTAKENQPTLTKRWTTEANLAAAAAEKFLIDNSAGRRNTRHQTKSCSSYFEGKDIYFMKQSRPEALTENAKKLSEEELYLLELDIFKPLDFYEILFDRMKRKDKEKCSKTPTLIRTFVIRL